MDRIDHYPQFQNQDDLHAGRITGEIKALREQQENFYFRDQTLNTEPLSDKQIRKAKRKESNNSMNDTPLIRSYELTKMCVEDHHRTNGINSSTSESNTTQTNDALAVIFVIVVVTSFVFAIVKILESIF